ncbi:glyoxalase/bleomycin resistance protein/dioxygenase, partial [mine drainage metagenome]
MPRVIHFEVAAKDMERAAGFYRRVFGWTVDRFPAPTAFGEYWSLLTGEGPGIDGALAPMMDRPQTINTIDVESVDDTIAQVLSEGGKVVYPKMTIPSIGFLAYCEA